VSGRSAVAIVKRVLNATRRVGLLRRQEYDRGGNSPKIVAKQKQIDNSNYRWIGSWAKSPLKAQEPFMSQVVQLHMLREPMKNYTYLVIDPSGLEAVIVDPAWQMEKIDSAIKDWKVELRGVLITHAHPDHVHLAEPVAQKYNCPIWMSNVEIAESGFAATRLIGIDSQPWRIGELLIEPILTPGHTPGSACYRIGENLFTGDVLFAEGCGMCPNTEAAYALFDSLERLKISIFPETRIFPGHSYGTPPGQTFAQLLRDNIYLQFSDKKSFAAFRLRSGQDKARMFAFV
jgi:hydroxyacylglutathione hydrolase